MSARDQLAGFAGVLGHGRGTDRPSSRQDSDAQAALMLLASDDDSGLDAAAAALTATPSREGVHGELLAAARAAAHAHMRRVPAVVLRHDPCELTAELAVRWTDLALGSARAAALRHGELCDERLPAGRRPLLGVLGAAGELTAVLDHPHVHGSVLGTLNAHAGTGDGTIAQVAALTAHVAAAWRDAVCAQTVSRLADRDDDPLLIAAIGHPDNQPHIEADYGPLPRVVDALGPGGELAARLAPLLNVVVPADGHPTMFVFGAPAGRSLGDALMTAYHWALMRRRHPQLAPLALPCQT